MTEIIIGIAMSIITQLAKKTKLDAKIIIAVLSIVFGAIYYFVKMYHPEILDEVIQKVIGAYGVSQVIYNYVIQLFIEKKEEKK